MNYAIRHAMAGLAVGATLIGAVGPSFAAEGSRARIGIERAYPGEDYAQYYRRGGYGGGAVAAGVIGGLAAGALVGGAIASSQPRYGYGPGAPVGNVYGHDPEWVNYCASRYRSFDPASGTYLARDGNRYVCQ